MLLHNLKKMQFVVFEKWENAFLNDPFKGPPKIFAQRIFSVCGQILKGDTLKNWFMKKTDVIPTCKVKWNLGGGGSPDYYVKKCCMACFMPKKT